ncbi:MAG: MATE family efflux transporter [Microbacteriaceae bacterium]
MSESTPTGDQYYLARAPVWRSLLHLCLPMMAAVSVGSVYNVINSGFVGSQHDTGMLAALAYGLPLFGLVMAVGGVFGVGGGSQISRLLGAIEAAPDDASASVARANVRRTASFAFWGALAAGAIVAIVLLALLPQLVTALGADAQAASATRAYVGVMVAFTPAFTAAFALEQLVRAEGAARASMLGIIWSTVANLVFDVLLILVLHRGAAGAAAAMGIGAIVQAGYYVLFLQRRSATIRLGLRHLSLRAYIVRPVFAIGVGELLQSSFLIVTSLVLNHLATGYGDGTIAAFGVAMRISQVPEFLCMGVTLGVLPLIAYSFGARRRDRLRAAMRSSAIAIGAMVVVFSGLVFLFREQVFGIFTTDAQVASVGVLVMTAQLTATIVNGFTALIITYYQGTARALPAMIMSIAQGVLFVPVVLLANAVWGLTGLIWAMTITEALCFVTALLLLRVPARADDGAAAEVAAIDDTSSVAATVETAH